MVIVGAEMIGTVKGLGALIMEARRFYRTDITIAGMITIGMIGFVISNSLAWLERFALPWNRGLDEVRR
jgi:ABC-type nitrate/sulfonate/bicarbonate transport system permease component